ncbi:GTPase HflX [Roseivirga pacifica]|uniref:GTPase HflX n=1 Tax=Roseivirga pacifica TaxID=1267423 RepID=UPI0020964C8F|nr:GTPase HflX [Roseivirga pacifica]MCO6359539.1 GTPase HflX [Roseivirga pacifica]MCO6366909.1 GTPase HflX [Roseivirga pacifica]MCO6370559.1 GTPase HflX [Roseivirga pacifica]MCO6374566.1 GTPase HflX [Roseivirga pacifica]MCO6379824.1 GTPase HflX [Roseivirga pacifica]
MGGYLTYETEAETAVMVALINKEQPEEKVVEYLDELAFLAKTLGLDVVKSFTQRLDKPDVRSFVGSGKLEEIQTYIKAEDIKVIIFDDDLSPSQLRNLERDLKVKIYDRSLLILDIFLERAQTAQAKTQVELARSSYLLPRLTRMWTHLERQRGGTGTRGGAGEKEIETDRRMIRNQITVLKKKLEKIEKQNEVQRKSRQGVVRVALVGYTNVGKSTLMRLLTKADVLAEDKLFATVDATVRKVVLDRIPFLLSDTVGFIRKLPTHLIESFKSTLAEVLEADVLLHVIDVSHPYFQDQMETVNQTLIEIGATNKPTILVFNKIDQFKHLDEELLEEMDNPPPTIDDLKRTYMNKAENDAVFISATEKQNMDEFREVLMEKVKKRHFQIFPNYLKDSYY